MRSLRGRGPGRSGRERLALGLVLLALGSVLVWARMRSHHDIDTAEREQLVREAAGLERALGVQLTSARTAMHGLREQLAGWPAAERSREAGQQLRTIGTALPGLGPMQWADAEGRVLASSDGRSVDHSVSGRRYFRQARARPDPARVIVSEPVRVDADRFAVELVVPLADDAGAFAGVISATLDSAYLSTILALALNTRDMRAAVVHGDGIAIACLPPDRARLGRDLTRPGSLFNRFRASGQPALLVEGPILDTGDVHFTAFHRLQPPGLAMDEPLVVAVGRPAAAVFEPWRKNTAAYAGLFAVGAVAASAFLAAFQRRRDDQERRDEAAAARKAADDQRLELALRGADLALWDHHVPSGRVAVDARWFSMLGHPPDSRSADAPDWEALLHPDDRQRVLQVRDDHIAGRAPSFDVTYRLRHARGDWVWVVNRGRVVERDAEGRAVRIVGTNFDATQLFEAEEALRRSERDLEITLQSIGDGVVATDIDGKVTRLNAAAEALTGWPAAEALGQPLVRVFRIVDARTRAPLEDPVGRVLAGGTVDHGDAALLLGRDGGERSISDRAAPIKGADGRVAGVVLVFSDVSRHRATVAALRDSEHQLMTLTAALPGPVARFDRAGRYLFTNATCERWFGCTAADRLGHDWRDVFPAAVVTTLEPHMQRALDGIAATFDTTLPTLAGDRQAMVSIVPDRDAAGAVQGCIVALTDITDRTRAEEALRQSEERLRRSEEQLRMASRLARLGGWRFDVASRRIALAPELAAMIGDRSESSPDDGFASAMSPADRERWVARLHRALDDGLPIDEEFAAVGADGRTAHWRVLGEAVRDAAGAMVAVQGAVQDVTDEREAQQQLRLLEAAVAGLNDAVLITEAGPLAEPGPRTIFVNSAFERMTGRDRAAMFGLSPRVLQGAETAGPELDRLREAVRTQQPVHVELINYRRDGGRYWVEISMVPLVDGSGRATHYVAVQRDITERRQAAAAVEAAQRELAATLSAVPDLLFDVDLDGRIHQCHAPPNGRHPLGTATVVGRRVADVFEAGAATVVMAALAEAHAHGHSAGRQYELGTRAGKQSFELSVSGKPAPAGEPPRFIVLARDVSERRQMEAQRRMLERQLREAQKMESIGTLAGGIAHDFNNILAAILGNLALARDDIPSDHPAQSTLGQIGKAGARARSLVQQILTFSRRQPNPLRPRSLRPVVEETLGLLRATLPAAVRLESRLADEELVVSADSTQLQQVLINLCTNAWQALPESRGRIEIGLEALAAGVRIADLGGTGPWAHVWVADDGAGMDAITRERIFDPFFTTKPVGQGTGLGLSVVHGIVRSHHGTVAVETALGRGSTFHLYFPLAGSAEVREGDTAHAPLAPPAPSAGGGEHLLYVDDDEVMVTMVERLMQRDGFRVTACGSAVEALGMVALPGSDFDLVVSDFNMPEMSGLDLAERLGRLRPLLPMIITSGYLTDELREGARAIGVRAVLQKERTLEELAELVRRVLAGATLA